MMIFDKPWFLKTVKQVLLKMKWKLKTSSVQIFLCILNPRPHCDKGLIDIPICKQIAPTLYKIDLYHWRVTISQMKSYGDFF